MLPLRDDQPRYSTPYFNYLLIVLNLVVFVYELALPHDDLNAFVMQFGVVPANIPASFHLGGHVGFIAAYLPLMTSMFIHASWPHVIFNMWFLWIFGDNVEDYLGHFRYLLFYLGTGVIASLVHILFNWGSAIPSVGASGAIAGVMGAYFVLYPGARVFMLFPPFWLPAWIVLGYWFVLQFLSGASMTIAYSNQTSGGIAVWAHVGGFIAGLGLIKVVPARRNRFSYG